MALEYQSGWNADQPRSASNAMKRGFFGRCPQCGEGRIFGSYLKVNASCDQCGLVLSEHRADDMPPYIVIMVVGHVIVALNLMFERQAEWPLWVHFSIWPPLTLISCLLLLQPVKGALIGYQWALKMHGFDPKLAVQPAAPHIP